MIAKTKALFWDKLGITLSGFCAIHCLFFPVVVALMPLWPVAGSLHQWTHPILFMIILPTVVLAIRKSGKNRKVIGLLVFGLLVIGFAWILHDRIGSWGESLVTLFGSGFLVAGHWINYNRHKTRCNIGPS